MEYSCLAKLRPAHVVFLRPISKMNVTLISPIIPGLFVADHLVEWDVPSQGVKRVDDFIVSDQHIPTSFRQLGA